MLAAALTDVFGESIHIDLKSGGMHLIARFNGLTGLESHLSDADLAHRAQLAGMNCRALSERCIAHDCDGGLLIGFANVASRDEAHRLSVRLRQALSMAGTAGNLTSASFNK